MDAWDEARLRRHFAERLGEPLPSRRVDDLLLPTLRFAHEIARGADPEPAERPPLEEVGARAARRGSRSSGASSAAPGVLGLSGPQGSGKSTLAAQIVEGLSLLGRRAVSVSIDDFYLTRDEQRALAAAHPGSRELEHRGYPGTHDVALGARTLDALTGLRAGERVRVPSYDKGAFAGRGDRRAAAEWPEVKGPLDLVVLEGWMLGFEPVRPSDALGALEAPNAALARYAAWHARLDAFVLLDVADPEAIVRFRVDAERGRRAAGEEALSDADAEDYIRRFLPAYRAWVPPLRARCAEGRVGGAERILVIPLGVDRLPLSPA